MNVVLTRGIHSFVRLFVQKRFSEGPLPLRNVFRIAMRYLCKDSFKKLAIR